MNAQGEGSSASTTPTSPGPTGSTRPITTRRHATSSGLPGSRCASRSFRELVAVRSATVGGQPITNRNDLLFSYPGMIGVKTGHTSDAGWSEVAAARRDGLTIYAVLLGGPERAAQRNADLAELLDWGFDQYRDVPLVRSGQRVRGGAASRSATSPSRSSPTEAGGRDRAGRAPARRAGRRPGDGRAARRRRARSSARCRSTTGQAPRHPPAGRRRVDRGAGPRPTAALVRWPGA